MSQINKQITIHTDGSCLGNPGPGGWAALLQFNGHEKLITGGDTDTTNNRMEMMAVIKALESLRQPCDIELYTDSKYVMDGATRWLKGWRANGWRTSQKKPVKNIELWQQLDKLSEPHNIDWHWVKAHAGHEHNERVDEAARQQAEQRL
ncbi:ribonuclease HI [Marinicella gelatinilytica]|uniref:ribonuclease HI n=1 Tax=Marinicella gelatinilytica TaxID=2996017 RepID=UPI002260E5FF|nr:ribonuclease HI [Marinicella gelatinilytica]MCX7543764.1 ribonuclease HI [Marinicella gelatinilytica]